MATPQASTRGRPWRLTEQVSCGGCASKLGPGELARVLVDLPKTADPNVIVDFSTSDDAGVYRLDDRTLLVQTVDFFAPVVDDPEAYGAIAAANALSDVYAMGGRPLSALSVVALPDTNFPPGVARAIFRGGAQKLVSANCALLGGHTVRDPEIKFGYAVTGIVQADQLMTNAAGAPGDVLVLTKALGTGIICTALKAGRAAAESVAVATRLMTMLNRIPSVVAARNKVRCATDVTGFGLMGHAWNIARESHLTLRFEAARLPLLPDAVQLAPGSESKGLKSNRAVFSPHVRIDRGVPPAIEPLLYDPQTSGGLLLLVPPDRADSVLAELPAARVIGVATPREADALIVT